MRKEFCLFSLVFMSAGFHESSASPSGSASSCPVTITREQAQTLNNGRTITFNSRKFVDYNQTFHKAPLSPGKRDFASEFVGEIARNGSVVCKYQYKSNEREGASATSHIMEMIEQKANEAIKSNEQKVDIIPAAPEMSPKNRKALSVLGLDDHENQSVRRKDALRILGVEADKPEWAMIETHYALAIREVDTKLKNASDAINKQKWNAKKKVIQSAYDFLKKHKDMSSAGK